MDNNENRETAEQRIIEQGLGLLRGPKRVILRWFHQNVARIKPIQNIATEGVGFVGDLLSQVFELHVCTIALCRPISDEPKVKWRLLPSNSRRRKQNETTKNLEVLLMQKFCISQTPFTSKFEGLLNARALPRTAK